MSVDKSVELMVRNYKLYQWIISESRNLPGHDGSELRKWLSRQNRLKLLLIDILLVSHPCLICEIVLICSEDVFASWKDATKRKSSLRTT
jgi:hypothetical protein